MKKSELSNGLLRLARLGDAGALEELFEQFGSMVFQTAHRLTMNATDADDVLQDVFLGLSAAIDKYEGQGSFEGWLKKVAVRTALMKLRQQRTRYEVSIDNIAPIAAPEEDVSTEDRLLLEAAVATLTEEQRQVFVMRAIEGYSHAEIGEMLGISIVASRSRYHRAVEQVVERCRKVS